MKNFDAAEEGRKAAEKYITELLNEIESLSGREDFLRNSELFKSCFRAGFTTCAIQLQFSGATP